MKNVALFIKYYSIGKSSPVINLINFLSSRFNLDIYCQEVWCKETSSIELTNINLIDVPLTGHDLDIIYEWGLRSRPAEPVVVDDRDFAEFRKKARKKKYEFIVCIDPNAYVLCNSIFGTKYRIYYYSLELFFRNNHFNLTYPKEVMVSEHRLVNRISGLLIQSKEREQLFIKEYSLKRKPVFILPVTYKGKSVYEKSSYLRDKYNIPDNKKIVLHLGGIQKYHFCIEIAEEFAKIEDNVLVFHGYSFGDYYDLLKNTIKQKNIANVIISDETFNEIEDMDIILKSSDFGIVWFDGSLSPNFDTVGKSSGKISAYMRFGLPVIAKKSNSTLEAVEQTGAGICIESYSGIGEALKKIYSDYNSYSSNAAVQYNRFYNFEVYEEELMNFFYRKEYNKIDF